jgi:hypothetical protein
MRNCFFLLTFVVCLWGTTSAAEQVIVGRVISIDREKGMLGVQKITGSLPSAQKTVPRFSPSPQKSQPLTTSSDVTVSVKSNISYNWIKPGTIIRIWGEFDKTSGRLVAKKLRTAGFKQFFSDPTGVRRRLEKGCTIMPGRGSGKSPGMGGGRPGRGRGMGGGRGHKGGNRGR